MGATFIYELWYIGRDRFGTYFVQVLLLLVLVQAASVNAASFIHAAFELKRDNLLLCGRRVNTSFERLICPSVNCNQWNNKLKYTNILHSIVLLCVVFVFLLIFYSSRSCWAGVCFFFAHRLVTLIKFICIELRQVQVDTELRRRQRKGIYILQVRNTTLYIVKSRDQSEVWRIIYCSRSDHNKKKMNFIHNNCLQWCY